ncbi:tetratricopeptide repeat protein [Salinicoccus sp. ID82-1]|uniref:Tetratricopeptide repeat protein n=1 Tax=Salinicoccus cyprini TaxID=2493691 RepID=A0A558AYK8_9STAP|nr:MULTISPECIES: tetratricopeptide repeat protein [Salinicoccus]MCG1008880.1 tetratricopeptide repeat protein [Salinicoccus sp. ID82-1]TVT29342.1 tetratricopeptide repeat protein [Salinicoccus cyprini]
MAIGYEQLIKEGRIEEALKEIFREIEEHPEQEAHHINAGNLLHQAGRDEEAERFLQKAITLNPGSTSAYYALANVYYDNERFQEAVRLYLLAYSRNPGDADLNFMLAMSHVHLGEAERALQFFEAAHKAKPEDMEITFQYGLLCCQIRLYDPAEKLLGEVIDKSENADAEYNMGLLTVMKHDDKEQALKHFRKAVEIQADHHLAHHAISKFETEE